MKYEIDINDDLIDDILLVRLKQDYISTTTVWKHQEYSKELAPAILKVIEYYSVPSDYEQWVKENVF